MIEFAQRFPDVIGCGYVDHGAEHTAFGMLGKPNSDDLLAYRLRMDAKKVLWANVSALMRHRYGDENLNRLAKECKIGLATVMRIKEQRTSIGLEVVSRIAKRFDLAIWQILVPGVEPANPPVLRSASPVERDLYLRIDRAITELAELRERASTEPSPLDD